MRLGQYLEESGEKPGTFAERIGVKRLAIYRYIRGTRRPAHHIIGRIAAATDGAVTANDFYDDPADPASPAPETQP